MLELMEEEKQEIQTKGLASLSNELWTDNNWSGNDNRGDLKLKTDHPLNKILSFLQDGGSLSIQYEPEVEGSKVEHKDGKNKK